MSSQAANIRQIEGNFAVDQPARTLFQWRWMERGEEPYSTADAASILSWWADAGVDILIDEQPRNWLRAPEKPSAVDAGAPADRLAAPQLNATAEQNHRSATMPGAGAEPPPDQLNLFQAWLKDSASLPFAAPAAPRVCPSGNPEAGLMILVDMPSTEDCGSGTLLSGEPGRLFDRMLAAIGRDRQSVYLAALSCLRSPSGQFATEAARRCADLARHHLGLVAPRAALLLGDNTAKALLGQPMPQARGRWHQIDTHAGPMRALVSLSPAALLKIPSAKAHAWTDLQMLMEELKG